MNRAVGFRSLLLASVTTTPENVSLSADDARAAAVRAMEELVHTTQDGDPAARADFDQQRERLRVAVATYVGLMRRDGVTPEQAIVNVKDALRSVGALPVVRRRIMNDIVTWCIEEYYR